MKKPFICHLHNGISSFSSRHFKQFKNSEDLKIVACNFKMKQGTCGFHKLIPSWIFFRFWSLAHLGHDSSRKHEMWKQALQSKKKKSKVQGNCHFMKCRNGLIQLVYYWVIFLHWLLKHINPSWIETLFWVILKTECWKCF